ncbi:hypothetical protein NCAS_0B01290 [Naumovozyma castellii]|uniref:Uncharacterized protein n=1 Tax=Naumovozyma castellii TaxID=27288 RepID=G0VB89_NAUCA|nr:hypothetical protein NCAS_0B01290 [Naumovozyma castellii CBS 4309]CCC68213.1 hypothetical protein NCAS_0B01290 [Naumovozyma castellii CBS 4309]
MMFTEIFLVFLIALFIIKTFNSRYTVTLTLDVSIVHKTEFVKKREYTFDSVPIEEPIFRNQTVLYSPIKKQYFQEALVEKIYEAITTSVLRTISSLKLAHWHYKLGAKSNKAKEKSTIQDTRKESDLFDFKNGSIDEVLDHYSIVQVYLDMAKLRKENLRTSIIKL